MPDEVDTINLATALYMVANTLTSVSAVLSTVYYKADLPASDRENLDKHVDNISAQLDSLVKQLEKIEV